ncbi:MAG: hypothetical protein ABSG98_03375 [Anaerolineales bacterium]
MDRKTVLDLADAALALGASAFARDVSRSWLAQWPGDFRVRGSLAQAYQQLQDLGSAARHIEIALVSDPEEIGLYQIASGIQTALGQEDAACDSLGFVFALSSDPVVSPLPLPSWAERLRLGLSQVNAQNYDQAQEQVEEVLRAKPQSLLPRWVQLKIAWLAGDYETVLRLGASTRQRWPGCAAVLLAMAQASLATGKSTSAVELLHLAAVADPAHEVGARMLGAFNPYLALWPAELEAEIPWPIPSAVAFAAGLNKLSAMTPTSDGSTEAPSQDNSSLPASQAMGPASSPQPDETGEPIRPLPGEHFRGPSGGEPNPTAPSQPSPSVTASSPAQAPVLIRPLPGEHFQGPSAGAANPAAPSQGGPSAPAPSSGQEPLQIRPLPGEHFQGPSAKLTPAAAEPQAAADTADTQSLEPQDQELQQVRAELDRVAQRLHMRKERGDEDRRRPSLIVLSSLANLRSQYGPEGRTSIVRSLSALVRSRSVREGWSARAIYVDDAETLTPLGLASVKASNAAEVKRLVCELDAALARRGEMIGALLIVGGHDIIPFHRLPNPADDDDHDVPSDNPYATRDDNYYLPEWPVSRIPSPVGSDPQFLLKAIERMMDASPAKTPTALAQIAGWIGLIFRPTERRFHKSLGYTASIWRSSSLGAYRPIGQSDSMLTSPPIDADTLPVGDLSFPRCSYFNLHGLEEEAEWYGQRSPGSLASIVEFPTALRPDQVSNSGRAPAIVFSEACYGANILGKTADTALALKFLESGTRALVGSTKIAYGAAAPPLIGADLVALYYWQSLVRGLPSGEALRQAKLSFAEEMRRRQGYLDGEDQKTLISFIHLGDPLFALPEFCRPARAKAALRSASRRANPDLLTVKALDDAAQANLPPDLVRSLQEVLKESLPGMSDSRTRVFEPQIPPGLNPDTLKGAAARSAGGLPAWVISLDKRFDGHGSGHAQFARVSLDAAGHLIKLVVSR